MTKLVLGTKPEGGYKKSRDKIDARVNLVVAELFLQYGYEEFSYSSIELTKKCGMREYAASRRDYFFVQTWRGSNLSQKTSSYRIRQEHITPEIELLSENLFNQEPVVLREIPLTFNEIRYVTFNLTNIQQAIISGQFNNPDKFKLKQLERALLLYGEQEAVDNEHLITLGIPHNLSGSRLYSTWPFCLQCTSSDFRELSVHGDSIDLDAAAVQCMAELGLKHGANLDEIYVLKEYIENKQQIRTELAIEFNVTEDIIKSIFNIMVLGGRASEGQVRANFRDSNSIARVVGDSIKASKIVASEFISSFYKAVKSVRKVIVDAMSEDIDGGWQITSANGITKTWLVNPEAKRRVKPIAKMAVKIYMDWELSTMTENTQSIGDRGLPMHDSRSGIMDLSDICDSFDSNNILYQVTKNSGYRFPEFRIQ